MITKDRYSKAFLIMAVGTATSMYFFRQDKGDLAALSFIVGGVYLAYLLRSSSQIHFTKEQGEKLGIQYKGETACKFSSKYKTEIDSLRISGNRFKFVNGTDICLNKKNEIVDCGFDSAIMQFIGDGGFEPKSIQNNVCWE